MKTFLVRLYPQLTSQDRERFDRIEADGFRVKDGELRFYEGDAVSSYYLVSCVDVAVYPLGGWTAVLPIKSEPKPEDDDDDE